MFARPQFSNSLPPAGGRAVIETFKMLAAESNETMTASANVSSIRAGMMAAGFDIKTYVASAIYAVMLYAKRKS